MSYFEEVTSGARFFAPVLNSCLLSQFLHVRDGRLHPGEGKRGRQVGRVRRDHDEREEPPDAGQSSGGQRSVDQQ